MDCPKISRNIHFHTGIVLLDSEKCVFLLADFKEKCVELLLQNFEKCVILYQTEKGGIV